MASEHAGGSVGVYNGQLFVATGSPLAGGTTTSVESYNPASNTWSPKASIGTGEASSAYGVIGTTLYVAGGCTNSDCLAGLNALNQAYDLVNDSWTTKAPLPSNLNNTTGSVINGKFYVAGGMAACGPCTALTTLYVYDPLGNSWSTKAPMPVASRNDTSAVVNNILYVFGGYNAANTSVIANVQAYDPSTDTWTAKTAMPTARSAASAVALNGIVYVMGGNTNSGVINVVEAYDPATNTWSTTTPMITGRTGLVGATIGNVIYTAGGSAIAGNVRVLEIFQ